MEGKKSTLPVTKPTKEGRRTETKTSGQKSKKVVDQPSNKNVPEMTTSLSIHSDLLTETYELNRKLLKEKDFLISVQKAYIDKCDVYNAKKGHLNILKKRMTQLLEAQDMESNFINLTEECVLPIEHDILEIVEGTINIL